MKTLFKNGDAVKFALTTGQELMFEGTFCCIGVYQDIVIKVSKKNMEQLKYVATDGKVRIKPGLVKFADPLLKYQREKEFETKKIFLNVFRGPKKQMKKEKTKKRPTTLYKITI